MEIVGMLPELLRVAQLVPMKRELKVIQPSNRQRAWPEVAQLVPMKRELKVADALTSVMDFVVAQLVPMKRELKE